MLGGAANAALGGGANKALIPKDLKGVRQQQIGYLQDPQAILKLLGQLGVPQSALQRQGADATGAMLNQPTPEQRALDFAMPSIQGMLTGTGPQFEHDIAAGNQVGNRFGSANALMRGEAYRNLYNMRDHLLGTLGLLSGQAGTANRGIAQQAFDTGKQQASQADVETQRRIQILMQWLNAGQQAAFNHPTQSGDVITPLLGQALGLAGQAAKSGG